MSEALIEQARRTQDDELLLRESPYARLLGMRCEREGDQLTFHLPADPQLIGNPLLPALHGGVIAGFIEQAALVHLVRGLDLPQFPELIDLSVDYLRAGLLRDSHARCQVWRQGRRVANVAVTVWQLDPQQPIAIARAHFKIDAQR